MPARPATVAFLWHMHQPWYGDPAGGRLRMPWVRLHALRSYLDMIAVLDDFPQVQVTFNLVPSLLAQLQGYVDGTLTDDLIELSRKPAEDLDEDERVWWLHQGFQIGWTHNVDPHPRYRELLDRRGRRWDAARAAEVARGFNAQDFRDLQVWYALAWTGTWVRRHNPVVGPLLNKARGYTEDDKLSLMASLGTDLATVIPRYGAAAREGRIELTTSPYYHPILPLLAHYPDVRAALPNVRLPAGQVDLPSDAAAQLALGRAEFERLFGHEPAGVWPSEGSVSSSAVQLIQEAGFRWAATDEFILALSLQRRGAVDERAGRNPDGNDLARPHRHRGVDLFFRHHQLSDRIGFDYHAWSARQAVADLLAGVQQAAARAPAVDRPVVSVILDGENCWEHYPRNGWDFLTTLYGELSRHPSLRAQTFSAYLDEQTTPPTLDYLFPGSWIGHSFHIWAGHREDQTAWELVYQTRAVLVAHADSLSEEVRERCWRHLYIAEGSDWYWWYGEDNHSDNDSLFDQLFRDHLAAIWQLLGQPAPAALLEPIKGQRVPAPIQTPVAFFTPQIDGRETHFFEWRAAGMLAPGTTGGAMQRALGPNAAIESVRYGWDEEMLYLAIEADQPALDQPAEVVWALLLDWSCGPRTASLRIDEPWRRGPRERTVLVDGTEAGAAQVAYHDLLEVGLPRELLPACEGESLAFSLTLTRDEQVVDRWPSQHEVDLVIPRATSWLADWLV